MLGAVCFASLALMLSYGAVPALALQAANASPDLVAGVVVSVEPHVVPQTGVVVSDVRVLGTRDGETTLTAFSMKGGEVGKVGMWSEQFADVRVGDSVVAGVAENNGQASVIAAPKTGRGLSGPASLSAGAAVISYPAGYGYDGIHWPRTALPVRYYVNTSNMPAGTASAVQAAARTWENDPGSDMSYTYMGSTSVSPSTGSDGVNVIGAANLGQTSTIALCTIWYDADSHLISQFDIQYNTAAFPFATNGSPSAYDVQGIGTHELGHTLHLLDLYDSPNSVQVMYGYGARGITHQRTLAWGDIAGIRVIYPTVRGRLSGSVTSGSVGLAGVSVSVPGYAPVTTGADGTYAISDIAPGTYDVMYSATGYETQILSVSISAGAITIKNVSLLAGADSDDGIPGIAAPASPISGSLDASSDVNDVYFKYLNVGQTLEVSLDGSATTGFGIRLYGVGAHSLADSPVASSTGPTYPQSLSYVAPTAGYYYIDARAATGSGGYSLKYATPMPVYRFYKKTNGTHFYTAGESEKNSIIKNLSATYAFEGVAYHVNTSALANSAPLYRFYKKSNGTHFYTAGESEKNNIIKNLSATYAFEGVAYYVCTAPVAGSVTVYRFYKKTTGTHFYTAGEVERDSIVKNLSATYQLEGPAFYLAP